MTEPKNSAARLRPEDKAERTTRAAADIINTERNASDAKVARLKALRMAGQEEVQPAAPAGRASTRRTSASTLRTIALQGDAPRKKAK